MPGLTTPDDAPDLIRCSPGELVDENWWTALELDLVVLYAWGDPVYRPVATAIRKAGIRLIQSLDTAGLTSPYSNPQEWWNCLTGMLAASQPMASKFRHIAKAMRDLFPGLYEKRRLSMIDQSDRVAAVSPAAALSIGNYARALGFPQIADKTILVPHSVPPIMNYRGEPKQNIVLAVGRWENQDAAQKDPTLMLAALKIFLDKHPDWQSEVVGRGGTALAERCSEWSPKIRNRMTWEDNLDREQLATRYARSKILFCPSRFESFHISSAEAVCSGCSVVVAEHALLASTAWFTTHTSGTSVRERKASALASGLADEVDAWDEGRRDPMIISSHWCEILHAARVAERVLNNEFSAHRHQ